MKTPDVMDELNSAMKSSYADSAFQIKKCRKRIFNDLNALF